MATELKIERQLSGHGNWFLVNGETGFFGMRNNPRIEMELRKTLRKRFLPPPWTFEDVLQQVHLHLLSSLGGNYLELLESGGDDNTKELKRAIRQAIGKARWRWEKRRQKNLPEVTFGGDEFDPPAMEQDHRIHLSAAFESLDEGAKQLLELKRAGYTVEEICGKLDFSRAEFYRRFSDIKSRLRSALGLPNEHEMHETGVQWTPGKP